MQQLHTTGCLLCGDMLAYQNDNSAHTCDLCGESVESNVACKQGHFVCDNCHAEKGLIHITATALQSTSKNPVEIASTMMDNPAINMHGPEHHYLVPAALLAAYRNAGGNLDLDHALSQARQRAKKVPGGICGMWGSCGAGIGAGIFVSITTSATPLAEETWSLANLATAQSLTAISQNGGPRCCKRDTWLSIDQAIQFSREHLGVNMDEGVAPICHFHPQNPHCRHEKCLYHPV